MSGAAIGLTFALIALVIVSIGLWGQGQELAEVERDRKRAWERWAAARDRALVEASRAHEAERRADEADAKAHRYAHSRVLVEFQQVTLRVAVRKRLREDDPSAEQILKNEVLHLRAAIDRKLEEQQWCRMTDLKLESWTDYGQFEPDRILELSCGAIPRFASPNGAYGIEIHGRVVEVKPTDPEFVLPFSVNLGFVSVRDLAPSAESFVSPLGLAVRR